MIFLTGFLVGVVSLIPGISGGTILIILKKYEEIAFYITNFKKYKKELLTLILGVILGTITFAKIIELLFFLVPKETLIIFSGFVLFNLKDMIKLEKKNFSLIWFILGILIMFLLSLIGYNDNLIYIDFPNISLGFLICFGICGIIDGFFTILPGISGSMIMMILGPYFLYKSYLANLSLQNIVFLLPLAFYFLGDLLGLFLGSKFSLFVLKKWRKVTISILLGMILMSGLIMIPKVSLYFKDIVYYLIFIVISYIITKIINLIS